MYEYKVVQYNSGAFEPVSKMEKDMNAMAEQGWRVVSVTTRFVDVVVNYILVTYEREKK